MLLDPPAARAPRTVLVLGGTSDIGRAVARAYAVGERRRVVLAGRDPARLAEEAADLRARCGCDALVATAAFDALDPASHAAFFDSLGETPETVVCVVGLLGDQARCEADWREAERVARANYLGPAAALAEAANRMEARGSGCIVGVGSVAGDRGRASNYAYGAAKAGLEAFLSGLRARLFRKGVHVATVKPGFVRTRMTAGMALPGLLTAEPEEVAAAVVRAEREWLGVVYVRPVWRLIMAVVRGLPEPLFKRTRF
jgi:short-subunit dehydrogenase